VSELSEKFAETKANEIEKLINRERGTHGNRRPASYGGMREGDKEIRFRKGEKVKCKCQKKTTK